MVHRQILEHSNCAGYDPAIATAPENLLAVRFPLLEESAVPIEQMLSGIVKEIRRMPPVRHGEIHVTFIVRGRIEANPRGRTHEQRIAPGPLLGGGTVRLVKAQICYGGRIRQYPIELFAHGRNHFWITIEEIKFRVGLPDALVVRMILALPKLPVIGFSHGEHGVAILGIAGNSASAIKPS